MQDQNTLDDDVEDDAGPRLSVIGSPNFRKTDAVCYSG